MDFVKGGRSRKVLGELLPRRAGAGVERGRGIPSCGGEQKGLPTRINDNLASIELPLPKLAEALLEIKTKHSNNNKKSLLSFTTEHQ